MNDNPYAAPAIHASDEPSPELNPIQRLVRAPSLGILVLAALPLPFYVVRGFYKAFEAIAILADPGPKDVEMLIVFTAPVAIFAVLIFCHAAMVRGAWNMRRLRRRRGALAAAWLASIPLVSPFLWLGIPFGVWALIVLRRADVKDAFLESDIRAEGMAYRGNR